MKVVNIHEANTNLSQLVESVIAGDEVIISTSDKPLTRLIPQTEKKLRTPGYWTGRVKMAEDFDNLLPPEILAGFVGMD